MFCPNCGKDNRQEIRYCASCGTNLEAVSIALSGREEDFFTKIDSSIDQFVARYSEHVFKDAPVGLSDKKVSKSWKLLGQAVLTSFLDIILFMLMWNILPLRFLILLISTPFRLLAERHTREKAPAMQGYRPPELSAPTPQLWLGDPVPSVTEGTTVNLSTAEKKNPKTTDQLE